MNEKLEDMECSGVMVNRPELGEATHKSLCFRSAGHRIIRDFHYKWSLTGKVSLKDVLTLNLKEEKYYVAAQGVVKKCGKNGLSF